MQFNKVHQELAKPIYEAIPKIAEKAGKKCPECKGTKTIGIPDKSIIPPAHKIELVDCPTCNGTGRIGAKKWKWEPGWGEMVIYKKMIALITGVNPLKEDNQYDMLLQVSLSGVTPEIRARTENVIPLLHWEDHLEPTLKGLGWDLWDLGRTVPSSDGSGSLVVIVLAKGKLLRCGRGKDCQEAFQRAVLAVAEGLG